MNDKTSLPYHFYILAIGEVLKVKEDICYYDLANFLKDEKSLSIFKPAKVGFCKLALKLASDCGFIKRKNKIGEKGELYYERNC